MNGPIKAWLIRRNGVLFYKIKSHPRYFISACGRIWSTHVSRELSVFRNIPGEDSYMRVGLLHNGKQKIRLLHRLLAETFIPNPEMLPIINHRNGVKHDNRLSNIEWSTHTLNIRHAVKERLNVARRGMFSHAAKLSPKDVQKIKGLLLEGVSQQKIADAFGVSRGCVLGIYTGKTWKNLQDCLHGQETRNDLQREDQTSDRVSP